MLRQAGHSVHAVYEACGFGVGMQRELSTLGTACHVIAPCKLDEPGQRVKTDGRDATMLCQRLCRYVDGNTKELAVIRVPSEEEERARAMHRQREALVRARTKLQAQGRALLVNHTPAGSAQASPAPATWWRSAGWKALEAHVPAWLCERLAVQRPVLAVLDAQIAGLSAELEAAAPAGLPAGTGKLTSVMLGREICDWSRFNNRRQVSRLPAPSGAALRAAFGRLSRSARLTGLCPGEYSSGGKRVTGSVTKHGNPRVRAALVGLAWRLVRFQPDYPPVKKASSGIRVGKDRAFRRRRGCGSGSFGTIGSRGRWL